MPHIMQLFTYASFRAIKSLCILPVLHIQAVRANPGKTPRTFATAVFAATVNTQADTKQGI